jgi:hypothetical protein
MVEERAEPRAVELTLYTEALIIRGAVRTREDRVTDVLNGQNGLSILLEGVTVEEVGLLGQPARAEYARVNLDAVLFARGSDQVEATPDARTLASPEAALVLVPPYRIVGTLALQAGEGSLRDALAEGGGWFIPVADATFWSDRAGEVRQGASLIALNHHRAQVVAPHREVDPWSGLDAPRFSDAWPAAEGSEGDPER